MNTPLTRGGALFGATLVALSVVATAIIGTAVNNEREHETNRANTAVVGWNEACAQVEALGGQCRKEPADIEDGTLPTPLPGPPGRPPTRAEIAAAVADYLSASPPPSGPPGQAGDVGASATTCPAGSHLQLLNVRLSNGGQSVQILACVKE